MASQHCLTVAFRCASVSSSVYVCVRESASFDLPHFDLLPLTSAVNLLISSHIIQTSDHQLMWRPRHKLLKTWQLLASCEGGPSPSWWWHLNCPALAQRGRPPATTHTHMHIHNHTHTFSCGGERTNTMTHTACSHFLFLHRCNVNANSYPWVHKLAQHTQFLLLPVPSSHSAHSLYMINRNNSPFDSLFHAHMNTLTHWSSTIMP